MKRLWIITMLIICVLFASCGKTPDLYEYAASLGEPNLLVREDGTIWRITEQEERSHSEGYTNYTVGDVEFVRELDQGEVNAAVTKKNADDMSLWEYAVCTWTDDRIAVAQDGSVWWFFPEDLWKNKVRKYDPAELIPEEERIDNFWLEMPEVVERHDGVPALKLVFHSEGNPNLINPQVRALEVLIQDVWYEVPLTWSTTADVKMFDKDGIYTFNAFPLFAGDYPECDVPIPSGHYRFRAYAYHSETARWKDGDRYCATVEFDLEYENGQYKIK